LKEVVDPFDFIKIKSFEFRDKGALKR
jgi:hypothetical protein